MEDLTDSRDLLHSTLKKRIPEYSHFIIKEAPNPWGWSQLADIKIFIDGLPYTVHVLYCGSASCFDVEMRTIISDWLKLIEPPEIRVKKRCERISLELYNVVFGLQMAKKIDIGLFNEF
jgi:hypothetical protein